MKSILKTAYPFLCKGWFYAFALFCCFMYEKSNLKQREMRVQLTEQLIQLQEMTALALQQQMALKNKVSSQSDQSYIELTLKKEIGVIAEGELKVMFSTAKNN